MSLYHVYDFDMVLVLFDSDIIFVAYDAWMQDRYPIRHTTTDVDILYLKSDSD